MPRNAHSIALLMTIAAAVSTSSTASYASSQAYTQKKVAQQLNWHANPNDTCGGYFTSKRGLGALNKSLTPQNTETHLHADGPNTLVLNGTSTLRRHVVITQPGRRIEADLAYVSRSPSGEITRITLNGHVHLYEPGKHIVSQRMTLLLPSRQVNISSLLYQLTTHSESSSSQIHRWGSAKKATQQPDGVIHFTNARFSSCDPKNPAWVLSTKELTLNPNTGKGSARMALLRWYGIPLLWTPYYSFPINSDRHSGLLTPSITHNTSTGFVFSQPIYWSIAPNKALTITPQWLSLRGFGLNTQFQFIDKLSQSSTRVQWHPSDTHLDEEKASASTAIANSNSSSAIKTIYQDGINSIPYSRYNLSVNHLMQLTPELSLSVILNRVSDPYYLRDMDGLQEHAESNQLRNQFTLNYQTKHWYGDLLFQAFQTLYRYDQPEYTVLTPYQRLPELTTHAYYANIHHLPIDFSLESSADYFYFSSPFIPKQTIGERLHVRPGISSTFERSYASITSSMYLDTTAYANTRNPEPTVKNSATRVVPIVSVDATTTLSHTFDWHGEQRTNIIKPRLFYLFVPIVKQNNLPNYDSYELPFTFSQLFTLNRFSGYDRLQNASQASVAFSDDLISSDSGLPLVSFDVGIEKYFVHPKACLTTNCNPSTGSTSPLVTDFRIPFYRYWQAQTGAAWDFHYKRLNNASFDISYSKDKHYQLHIGYQYTQKNQNTLITPGDNPLLLTNDSTNALKLGGQWLFLDRWHGLSYIDYDFDNHRINSYYIGVEYDACCWQLQLLLRRAYISSTINTSNEIKNQFNTGVYLNLVLTGLGNLGNTSSLRHLLSSTLPRNDPTMP